ncbi:uncharacterized protein J3R85_011131 [Psidium guajava]|nr:uncharacterized protein J3R85_011131 [Psidium guajava]
MFSFFSPSAQARLLSPDPRRRRLDSRRSLRASFASSLLSEVPSSASFKFFITSFKSFIQQASLTFNRGCFRSNWCSSSKRRRLPLVEATRPTRCGLVVEYHTDGSEAPFLSLFEASRSIRATSISKARNFHFPPNTVRRKMDPSWRGRFSLGANLGSSHTGVALGRAFCFRPLMVVELRGQRVELRVLDIAKKEEGDEFHHWASCIF